MKTLLSLSLLVLSGAAQAADMCPVRFEGDFLRSEVVKSALQEKGFFESASPEYVIRLQNTTREVVLSHHTHIRFETFMATLTSSTRAMKASAKSAYKWTAYRVYNGQGYVLVPQNARKANAKERAALDSLVKQLPFCSNLN